MTLIERLEKYFGNLYDADVEILDGGAKTIPNEAGRIWERLTIAIAFDEPLCLDLLMDCEEYFEKCLHIGEEEQELMHLINHKICEILTSEEQ